VSYRYTLNFKLQFELVDFCTYVLFISSNNCLYTLFRLPFDEGTIITPDIAYGCETWPSVLTDEQELKVIENGVMRKIF
jgi:hypothetical protein